VSVGARDRMEPDRRGESLSRKPRPLPRNGYSAITLSGYQIYVIGSDLSARYDR
jgi:hypothetical protein